VTYQSLNSVAPTLFPECGEGRALCDWLRLGRVEMFEPVILQFARVATLFDSEGVAVQSGLNEAFIIDDDGVLQCRGGEHLSFGRQAGDLFGDLLALEESVQADAAAMFFIYLRYFQTYFPEK